VIRRARSSPNAGFCIPGGAIAQLGERLLCKQEVVGSIPSGSTKLSFGSFAENVFRLRHEAAKPDAQA
jgi:hypothetical protein